MSLILFTHDCLNEQCPEVLKNYFETALAPYNTRQEVQLRLHRARTSMGSSRVQYQAARIWNELQQGIKSIQEKHLFKKKVKNSLLGLYL